MRRLFGLVLILGINFSFTKKMDYIKVSDFGTLGEGEKVQLFTLRNDNGMEVGIINYGGIIVYLTAPDKNGKFENVVLGYEALKDYQEGSPYFGAIIGRYGNRIKDGKFSINGTAYQLPINNEPNSLHGGKLGFDKVFWKASPFNQSEPYLVLSYFSKDDEQGYPGNLDVKVTYRLQNDNSLKISYEAKTDKETIVNLTNHSYFNLSADFNKNILDHRLTIEANQFLPIDSSLIPTGEVRKLSGTAFDFRGPTKIGARIEAEDLQLKYSGGYDHCFVFTDSSKVLKKVASVSEAVSGRKMDVFTTEPALQFYSGNFLDGKYIGAKGENYKHRTGFCLETQHYPNSPNEESFPTTILKPGEQFSSETVYKFY